MEILSDEQSFRGRTVVRTEISSSLPFGLGKRCSPIPRHEAAELRKDFVKDVVNEGCATLTSSELLLRLTDISDDSSPTSFRQPTAKHFESCPV
jgi:hypothetical protein